MKILLLMMLFHIIDDFVLQSASLGKLKQRDWWKQNAPDKLYENDYKAALCIHALSWAIMIHLPLMFSVKGWLLGISVLINGAIHYIVDDLKANKHKLNLSQDQAIHFLQIFITHLIL